jgi:hypothetical protein
MVYLDKETMFPSTEIVLSKYVDKQTMFPEPEEEETILLRKIPFSEDNSSSPSDDLLYHIKRDKMYGKMCKKKTAESVRDAKIKKIFDSADYFMGKDKDPGCCGCLGSRD